MGPSLVTGFAPFPGPQQWVATPRLSSVYQWGVAITKPLFLPFFFLALRLPTVVAYLSCPQCNLFSLTSHPLVVPRVLFMLPLVTCTPCTSLRLAMFRPTPHTNSKCSPTLLQLINSSLAVNQVFKHLYLIPRLSSARSDRYFTKIKCRKISNSILNWKWSLPLFNVTVFTFKLWVCWCIFNAHVHTHMHTCNHLQNFPQNYSCDGHKYCIFTINSLFLIITNETDNYYFMSPQNNPTIHLCLMFIFLECFNRCCPCQ